MANNQYYGYTPKKEDRKVGWQNNSMGQGTRLDRVNPYEFKKGMYYELDKMGTSLRESEEDQREKATETILKNLEKSPAYYSYMEHYEVTTRNMDRKPTFNSFLKELEAGDVNGMKEVGEKFTEDKMKEIKLKENIRAEVRNKINEILKTK
jgi:hypothetical protein